MWVLVLVAAVLVGLVMWGGQAPRRRKVLKDTYTSHLGVDRTYVLKDNQATQATKPIQDTSPLTPYLQRVLDSAVPASAAGESVPYTEDEVRALLLRVVQRINARTPDLQLVLVGFDNVTKTVDAYKTLRYEADVQVHSSAKMYSSRLTAGVDVGSDGKEYIRELRVHSAMKDTSAIKGSNAIGSHDNYAVFEPVVVY